MDHHSYGGFNPCFSGYAWLIQESKTEEAVLSQFQSLFFWICVADKDAERTALLEKNVSILVFLDMRG